MKIINSLANFFATTKYRFLTGINNIFDPHVTRIDFANLVFLNIVEILTDLANDVAIDYVSGNTTIYAEFRQLFNTKGQYILNQLFKVGYVPIGYRGGFFIMNQNQYTSFSDSAGNTILRPIDPSVKIYVMKSATYENTGSSDYTNLSSFLTFLDNALNASNTITSRLGSLVVGSPKVGDNLKVVFDKEDKDELEQDMQSDYGSLSTQKQIMLLSRPMDLQVINLAGLDQKTAEKVRMCVLAICDRIKVPANQVAIIDAMSSKSFANGSELREGDFSKYQSFERLFNATFNRMAEDLDLKINYTIYNKPVRTGTTV